MGWVTFNLGNETTVSPPAIAAITNKKQAIALMRSDKANTKDQIRYVSWMQGTNFSSFATLNVPTRTTPAVGSSSDAIHVVYHALAMDNYYYAQSDGATFVPGNEPVGPMGAPSLGLAAPGLAVLGTNPVIANPGWDNAFLYDQTRAAGVWQAGIKHDPLFAVDDVPPAIAALAKGPELLIVFTAASDKQLYSIARTGGNWGGAVMIPGAKSIEPVLLALPAGGAILAFRDAADMNKLKWSRFDGTAWSVAVTNLNVTPKSKPALAVGAGDAEAELVYVDNATGVAWHKRLQSGTFTAGDMVSATGSLLGVAAVTVP